MLDEGAIEEINALKELALPPDLPIMRALGVKPLLRYLDGEIALQAAAEQAKTESRRYAKRQLTWFKRNMMSWNWR
jgi:tRNA dimethylallyltransferase